MHHHFLVFFSEESENLECFISKELFLQMLARSLTFRILWSKFDKILWYKLRVPLFTSKLLLIFILIRLNKIPWQQQHSVKFFLVHTGNNWWYYNFSDVLQTFIFLWHHFKKSGRRRQRYLKNMWSTWSNNIFVAFQHSLMYKIKILLAPPNSLCCPILASSSYGVALKRQKFHQ